MCLLGIADFLLLLLFLKTTGDVPCNIKFIIEGEEEIGSVSLEKYISKYGRKLAADGVIWEFGYIDEKNTPIISLRMKGLLYVELIASGPPRDVHSSLAVLIENPAWRLVQALNTIRGAVFGQGLVQRGKRIYIKGARPYF